MQLQFYTQESLGSTRHLTPEGFLLCANVPLARTGTLLYADGEVPVDAGPNGIISIARDEDEVFHPNAMASFAGKPITNDHPLEQVDPDNWKQHAIGVVMHPRRGDGRQFDDQYLYADLLIQDRDAIKDVLNGKREVSAGYDANYEQIAPGHGRQSKIIGNHVALVDKGRCGPRCAIGDRAMPGAKMAQARNKFARFRDAFTKSEKFRDAIIKAARSGDEEGASEKFDEMIGEMISGTNDELNPAPTNEWEGDPREKGEKSIVINVHGSQNPGNSPMSTASSAVAAPQDDAPAVPGAAPAPAAAAGGDPMAAIMQRLQAMEQALAMLMQKDGPDDEGSAPPDKSDTDDAASKDKAVKDAKGTGKDEEPDLEGVDPEENSEAPAMPGTEGGRADADDKKTATGDAARVATADSRALASGWAEMVKRGMILVPDATAPTFDAMTTRAITIDRMCAFRKQMLVKAYKNEDVKPHIEALLDGKPDFKNMTCDAASAVFNAASQAVRDSNNSRMTNPRPVATRGFGATPVTPAEINKRNRERFNIVR